MAHTSLPSLVLEQAAARAQGVSIFTETCAQYLYLTEEDLKKQGPFAKFTPRQGRKRTWKRCGGAPAAVSSIW